MGGAATAASGTAFGAARERVERTERVRVSRVGACMLERRGLLFDDDGRRVEKNGLSPLGGDEELGVLVGGKDGWILYLVSRSCVELIYPFVMLWGRAWEHQTSGT